MRITSREENRKRARCIYDTIMYACITIVSTYNNTIGRIMTYEMRSAHAARVENRKGQLERKR